MRTLTRDDLLAALASPTPPVLLEALPPEYFDAEHLPGARNLPLDAVEELAERVSPDRDAMVVTYCTGVSCPNSKEAARKLQALGYTNVYAYEGGKEDWRAAGLAFHRDEEATA